ncbi:ATP-grasp domain-containing protein [Natrialbaceae archaeon A-arb3/5]
MDQVNNILVTSSGRRSYLIEYFKESLDDSGMVFAADHDPLAPVFDDCDQGFVVPSFDDDEYIRTIRDICKENEIDLLVPTNDYELMDFSEAKKSFQEVGTEVLISESRCISIALDKVSTYEFLTSHDIPTPFTTPNLNEIKKKINSNEVEFPIIIKPRYGSGSEDIYQALNEDELEVFWERIDQPIAQKQLQGQEYGIDVFNDRSGNPVSIVPRKKIAMRAGETDKAVSVHDRNLIEVGLKVAKDLSQVGPLDVDCFYDGDDVYVMELNSRFGGGYPLTHIAGGDFTGLAIEFAENELLSDRIGEFEPGVHMVKTYSIYNPPVDPNSRTVGR